MATISGAKVGALRTTLNGRATYTGIWGWVTTVDHKRIGVLYGITAVIWLLVGGLEALAMRLQLARPDSGLIDPDIYNQLFTMHGTTMIFLVVMPLSAAFFNFLVPLMIGARDVAFPRLNAFSYWMFLVGGLFLNSSYFLGGAPDAGWFGYANVTSSQYNPGHGIDFWVLGLALLGVSSVAAALNFIVTIINMRAPGMTLLRMPVFIWMTLVTSVLLVMAFPIITVALVMLAFDRLFGTNFFVPEAGGSVVLWQHMFWLFGHPEVYILILPAMGIVSEVLPTFSRKPLFGYYFVIFSGILIAFMGFGVWSHHMFTVGMGPAANSVFAATTMAIAVPTGVKIFNWLGTLWGGSISLKPPLLFAVGFIFLFVIGGLSGMTHAAAPSDLQQQDTYYIVAHLHYVLFGGSLFALFAGIYYWFPKFTGRILNEGLGTLHFILMFLGMNLAFGPMHNLGMDGMPRRIYTYAEGQGWDSLNLLATLGAFLMAISFLAFLHNFFYSLRKGEKASNDPWDGRTLEWSIPSPPPLYNFAQVPSVKVLDDYWRQKQEALDSGLKMKDVVHDTSRASPHLSDAEDLEEAKKLGIHMPGTSYWPILVAVGMMIAAYGLMYVAHPVAIVTGVVGLSITIWAIYSWAFEPVADPGNHHTETDHAAQAVPGEEPVH